jgi:hypothetical protein
MAWPKALAKAVVSVVEVAPEVQACRREREHLLKAMRAKVGVAKARLIPPEMQLNALAADYLACL